MLKVDNMQQIEKTELKQETQQEQLPSRSRFILSYAKPLLSISKKIKIIIAQVLALLPVNMCNLSGSKCPQVFAL